MKFRWDNRYLHWGVTAFLVIAASMLFYYGIFHMKTLIVGIKTFLGIMAPIIYGVILAYILSPLINLFEQKLIYPQLEKHNIKLQKKGKRAIRWGCVLFSMFLFWIIIYALLMMVLPQLIRSIMSIIYSFPYYIKVIEKRLNSFVEHGWKLNPEMLDMINQYSVKAQEYLTTDILPQMQDMLKNVSAGIFDILIFMKNFLIGAIVALYVLADKEKFVAKSKMMVYAILPHKWANMLIRVMRFTDKSFVGFIYGKLLDSAIIGILCFFGMLLLDLPYPILISVIIGVTNVIPFFGPFIGAIPSFIIIVLQNPVQGLYFLIFIVVLQQIDGNIIGPKILGSSTGLSAFWVVFAILVFGGLWGFPGMLLGVPLMAVIYYVAQKTVSYFLKKRGLTTDTLAYVYLTKVDKESNQPVYDKNPSKKELKKHHGKHIEESIEESKKEE